MKVYLVTSAEHGPEGTETEIIAAYSNENSANQRISAEMRIKPPSSWELGCFEYEVTELELRD